MMRSTLCNTQTEHVDEESSSSDDIDPEALALLGETQPILDLTGFTFSLGTQ